MHPARGRGSRADLVEWLRQWGEARFGQLLVHIQGPS